MGAMLAGPQDDPVDRVLVQLQQPRRGPHANPLGRVVDDLADGLGRQMQAKQGAGLGGGKALATSAAVKQVAAFVLAILAAHGDVAAAAQSVILALFVGAVTLFKFAHRLPPIGKSCRSRQSYFKSILIVNYMGTSPSSRNG